MHRYVPEQGAQAIDLAAVPDFVLGSLRVQPSLRRVGAGAREESVEPRVMQALVALVEAGGAVVSRDALIDRCWAGRIVGEDAINRCIAKVRKLAEMAEPPAFTIETVSKVGYRLQVQAITAGAPAGPSGAQAASRPPGPPQSRAWRTGGIVAALAFVAVASAIVWRHAPPPNAGAPPFSPPPHSVAILAFANMSADPAQEYFSEGLSEELIDMLSRVQQLHVIGRTSSFSFKGKPVTIEEIGRKLNVGAVLEGSVRRQGNRLRIAANLNDTRTGYQLWTREFDRDQSDLLLMQTEVASAVTEALQVTLLGDEAANLAIGSTNDPKAFDEYLQGVRALRVNTVESYQTAIAHFDSAVKIDASFALAHSGRADAVSYLAIVAPNLSSAEAHRMFSAALASADRGVALAPGLGLTHAARGFVLNNGLLDHAQAFDELTRAQAATPGNATINMIYAGVAITVGHVREAVAAAHRAAELDPLRPDTWGCLGFILFQARQYGAALDALQHAHSVTSLFPPQFVSEIGLTLLMQNKPEAARQTCAATPEWEGTECLAFAYNALGRRADASAELVKLRAELGDTGAYSYAEIYAQWGQADEALDWLTRAAELKNPGIAYLGTDPLLDPIRADPKYEKIRERVSAFPPL